MNELRKIYLAKLAKVASIEDTILEHLPNMIANAANADLKAGLSDHLEETRAQRGRLTQILSASGGTSLGESDDAFKMMVENAESEIAQISDADVRDAAIIAAAQTVEHVEMAKYGTLVEWAHQLGDSESQTLLEETLREEQAADRKLSGIAEGGLFMTGINERAAE